MVRAYEMGSVMGMTERDLRQMCARDHGLVSCQSSGPWRVKGEGQDTVPAVPRTALPEESMLR
jgi:hypothetical protein